MFFVLSLKKNLLVTPEFLGQKLSTHLHNLLKKAVEGSFSTKYGYIVKVLTIDKAGAGKVQDGDANVIFPLSYKALVFMPYKGEILDAIVEGVSDMGFEASVGPLKLYSAKPNLVTDYYFDEEARPQPRWVHRQDPNKVIQPSGEVRVKISGTRVSGNDMFGVCDINEEYLGTL